MLRRLYPLCILLVSCASYNHSPRVLRSLLLPISPTPSIPSHAAKPSGVTVLFWWCVITRASFTGKCRDETDENTARSPPELLTG